MNDCLCGCGEQPTNGHVWVHGHNGKRNAKGPDHYRVLPNGCWEWKGQKNSQGYGVCDPRFWGVPEAGSKRKNGQYRGFAHRASYWLRIGPVPDALIVRHLCDNPSCVNPEHLVLGTRADNARDRVERSRTKLGRTRQDFCKRGHSLNDPDNVRLSGGRRRCRACARILDAESRARR